MNTSVKFAGALVGAALLSGAGVAAAVADSVAEQPLPAENEARQAQSGIVQAPVVEGTFSFSQDVLTPNSVVKNAFQKVGASLCASAPQYCDQAQGWSVTVSSENGEFSATVEELCADPGNVTAVMGCACTSNGIGGSAIANVSAQGIPLSAFVEAAGL